MKFNELNLSAPLNRAIMDHGYQETTYIQSAAIPVILSGGDLIGQSQTGTGKTAAFAIPILEKLQPTDRKQPQALILSPTRELAMQVSDEIRQLAKYKEDLRTVTVYGGQPISRQIIELKKGADIIVGTPGRILDHIRRKTLRFGMCHILVLDEADEMLNMGFREDIETIMEALPEPRQTILFSATMPQPILDLTSQYLQRPVHIKAPSTTQEAPKIEQVAYLCSPNQKQELLLQLLALYQPKFSMIFCNTKKMADELATELIHRGYPAAALHGDMKQETRNAVMDSFRKRRIKLLVATDVAARGIDVDELDIVFNFDFPQEMEYYIHRIGRTGRAGKGGLAVTIITARQKMLLTQVQRTTKQPVTLLQLPSFQELQNSRFAMIRQQAETWLDKKIPNQVEEQLQGLIDQGITWKQLACAFALQLAGPELTEIRIPEKTESLQVTQRGMSTLLLDIGSLQQIQPAHIVSAIAGAAGISGKHIGKIHISDVETSVEIPAQYDLHIVNIMKNTKIQNHIVHPMLIKGKSLKPAGSKNYRKPQRTKYNPQ